MKTTATISKFLFSLLIIICYGTNLQAQVNPSDITTLEEQLSVVEVNTTYDDVWNRLYYASSSKTQLDNALSSNLLAHEKYHLLGEILEKEALNKNYQVQLSETRGNQKAIFELNKEDQFVLTSLLHRNTTGGKWEQYEVSRRSYNSSSSIFPQIKEGKASYSKELIIKAVTDYGTQLRFTLKEIEPYEDNLRPLAGWVIFEVDIVQQDKPRKIDFSAPKTKNTNLSIEVPNLEKRIVNSVNILENSESSYVGKQVEYQPEPESMNLQQKVFRLIFHEDVKVKKLEASSSKVRFSMEDLGEGNFPQLDGVTVSTGTKTGKNIEYTLASEQYVITWTNKREITLRTNLAIKINKQDLLPAETRNDRNQSINN